MIIRYTHGLLTVKLNKNKNCLNIFKEIIIIMLLITFSAHLELILLLHAC